MGTDAAEQEDRHPPSSAHPLLYSRAWQTGESHGTGQPAGCPGEFWELSFPDSCSVLSFGKEKVTILVGVC